MPQERIDKIIKAVERLGIATVICGFLLFAGWRVGSWFGTKIAEPFADEQIAIMRETRETLAKNAETSKLHAQAELKNAEAASKYSVAITEFKNELRLWRKQVVALPDGKAVQVEPRDVGVN